MFQERVPTFRLRFTNLKSSKQNGGPGGAVCCQAHRAVKKTLDIEGKLLKIEPSVTTQDETVNRIGPPRPRSVAVRSLNIVDDIFLIFLVGEPPHEE